LKHRLSRDEVKRLLVWAEKLVHQPCVTVIDKHDREMLQMVVQIASSTLARKVVPAALRLEEQTPVDDG
jgi:hypothetical protein